ncbi:MAG: hypothetical protein M9949_06170 [Candidatus Kapabacteria bacterium]|nr:hypothetical protein [Candidatus Kapabacteria bacterium]
MENPVNKTDNIGKLLTKINSLLSYADLQELEVAGKVDLLVLSKEIRLLTIAAKEEAKNITDDQADELSLRFGDAFFKILRG